MVKTYLLTIAIVLANGCPSPASEAHYALADRIVNDFFAQAKPDDNRPKPGDTCPQCDGKGYVGDGRVRSDCLECDSTGKVQAARMGSSDIMARIEALESKLNDSLREQSDSFKAMSEDVRQLLDSPPPISPEPARANSDGTKPVIANRIIMHSVPGCTSCAKWAATQAQQYGDMGWSVKEKKHTEGEPGKSYPYFEIYDEEGERHDFDGVLSKTDFLNLVGAKK